MIDQAEIRLMDQGCRLKGVARSLAAEHRRRNPPELAVDLPKELFLRLPDGAAGNDGKECARQFWALRRG
jgi:hypothetical protein